MQNNRKENYPQNNCCLQKNNRIVNVYIHQSLSLLYIIKSIESGTRLLNLTFKQYRVKFSDKIRPHPPAGGPRPKSRLTVEGCDQRTAQNLSFLRFRNTSPDPVGFYFHFMRTFIIFYIFLHSDSLFAQNQEQALLEFEKKIEAAVVASDTLFLQTAYAHDFRFKHGTGLVDSKESWLKDVANNKGKFISRIVASAEAELHVNIGITQGVITVTRIERSYTIQYVRAYRKKGKQWQLFMHRTVQEIHAK